MPRKPRAPVTVRKPGPLRARVMYSHPSKKQPWWVRVSWPNGLIAFKSENYVRRRDAQNAADALESRGVVVVE